MSLLRRIERPDLPSLRDQHDEFDAALEHAVQKQVEQMLHEKGVWLGSRDEDYLHVIVWIEVRDYLQIKDIQLSYAKRYELVNKIVANLSI